VRDALVAHGLGDDRRLRALLDLLLEDTVHAPSSVAPLVNGAMGVNIRGAGLTRFRGGAWGFWKALIRRYRELGGDLRVRCPVTLVEGRRGAYRVTTAGGVVEADQVVAAVPIEVTARIASTVVGGRLDAAIRRDGPRAGGAAVLFLGVPDAEVADAPLTHHGVYVDYDRPLGDGNNVFVSVSAPGDVDSAPPGRRAVMVSTHTDPAGWHDLSDADYERRKDEIGAALLSAARRVHPQLGRAPGFRSSGTPRTYARFLGRPGGAVGGPRQSLDNTNQRAVPHDVGVPGLHLVGDTTWPGLGTVSVLLGSGVVADALLTS
jgi:phytoene dehydrogenase-like protein